MLVAVMTSQTQDLSQEATLMTRLRRRPHPRLLPLLAVEYDASSRVSMVAPIARFGSMLDLMDHLEFEDALAMYTPMHAHRAAAQLIEGVAHLHRLGLDHGDLSVRNVLVFDFCDRGIEVKLGDYGETRPGRMRVEALASLVLQVHALVPR